MEFENIKSILYDVLDDKNLIIREDNKLIDELGICSYDMMTIIAIIESETGKKINLKILMNDLSVKGLMDSIE